jgi:uncharacterized protein (DUF1330 family)
MAVYLVIQDVISDSHRFEQYAQCVKPIIQRYGSRMITVSSLDIAPVQQTIVFECPSREDAVKLWNCDEYTTVRNSQETAAPLQAMIVEGNLLA